MNSMRIMAIGPSPLKNYGALAETCPYPFPTGQRERVAGSGLGPGALILVVVSPRVAKNERNHNQEIDMSGANSSAVKPLVEGPVPVDGDVLAYSEAKRGWIPETLVDERQINVVFKLYSDGSAAITRKAKITKIGNTVAMMIQPFMGVLGDGLPTSLGTSDRLSTYVDGVAADNHPIPSGWRPPGSVAAPWPIEENSAAAQYNAFLRANPDGSIDVAKNPAFDAIAVDIGGSTVGMISWIVDDFT